MSLGPCPKSLKQVSSSASICTFCGNTNFLRKTGNEQKVKCDCSGNNTRCRRCKVQGITSSRRSGIPESRYHNGHMAFYETKPLERLSQQREMFAGYTNRPS